MRGYRFRRQTKSHRQAERLFDGIPGDLPTNLLPSLNDSALFKDFVTSNLFVALLCLRGIQFAHFAIYLQETFRDVCLDCQTHSNIYVKHIEKMHMDSHSAALSNTMSTPVILLTSSVFQLNPGAHHDLLKSGGFDVIKRRGPLPESELLELVGDVDAILCDPDDITVKVIEKAIPQLKVITKVGAGTASIDLVACKNMGVDVFNTAGLTQEAVAEHTIALTLSAARNIVTSSIEAKDGIWRRRQGVELRGKNFGIIGYGGIGCTVAKVATALGMNVHGFRRNWEDDDGCPDVAVTRHTDLHSIMAECPFISLHAPLTAETHHIINADAFAAMKDSTILVNTSRAALVEETALLRALDSDRLACYAADVMPCEPPDPDHPILTHPKSIITPHVGGLTKESIPRQLESATRRLLDYFDRSVLVSR